MKIPRKIYQTWYTRDFHPIIQENFDFMRKLNPTYEFILFDDREMGEFVAANFPPDVVCAYNSLNIMAARADYWRYLILYLYGGIYLDIDSYIVGSLDKLIRPDDSAIISLEGDHKFCMQWCLMFESGHPILERVILLATKNILENKYPNDVMKMTGPLVLTEAVNQIHAELFEDPIPYEIMDETTDITFDRGGIKYRIYSQDYGEFCIFECIHHQYLYINRPKWVDQIRYTPLLVGGTVNPDMV